MKHLFKHLDTDGDVIFETVFESRAAAMKFFEEQYKQSAAAQGVRWTLRTHNKVRLYTDTANPELITLEPLENLRTYGITVTVPNSYSGEKISDLLHAIVVQAEDYLGVEIKWKLLKKEGKDHHASNKKGKRNKTSRVRKNGTKKSNGTRR
jgi:hypothetical protein